MQRTAVISPCGQYRYRLGRRWTLGAVLLYVMLNPSTADAVLDDPTIRRCIGFAQAEGFGAIEVVNLYAWRSASPAALKAAGYPVGPDADMHLFAAASEADAICLAWGAIPRGLARVDEVLTLLRPHRSKLKVLALTKDEMPCHPLYLPAACRMQRYAPSHA